MLSIARSTIHVQRASKFCDLTLLLENHGELLLDLPLLLLALELLLLDSIYEHNSHLAILHTFDLTISITESKERFDFRDFFRAKADIPRATVFPIEGYWSQTLNYVET